MKKITYLFCLFFIGAISAQVTDVTYTFGNPQITNDGTNDFYEVDIFISSISGFQLGGSQIFINYNPDAFGEAVIMNGTGEFLENVDGMMGIPGTELAPGLGFYTVIIADNTASRISYAANQLIGTALFNGNQTVSSTPSFFARLRLQYLSGQVGTDPMVAFEDGSLFVGNTFTACGGALPPDCINLPGDQILDDTFDSSGAEIQCTQTTTYTMSGWDNGVPDAFTSAIVMANYNTADSGDIRACELTVTNDAILTVSDNNFIDVVNDITVAMGSTLAVANAGSVVQLANDAITINNGTITVAKTTPLLDPRDFVVLGSPMSGETSAGVYGSADRAFEIVPSLFDPFPGVDAVVNFVDVNFDYFAPAANLTPGEGYLIFPQNVSAIGAVTFDHTYTQGTLNSGTINYPLVYNGPATENNFNVAGNPYASAIDNNLLLTENEQISALYFWEHLTDPSPDNPGDNSANFSMDDISVYNLIGGIPAVNGGTTPGQFMTSGQGFGILANQSFDGDPLVFTNDMRVTANNGTVRSSEITPERIWLSLNNATFELQSTVLIGFTEQASINFDRGFDSNRLDSSISLFSILENGEQLSIQGREAFSEDMEIDLGFSTFLTDIQNYTISLDQIEGIALEQVDVLLIDNVLNVVVNLKEGAYSFTSGGETSDADRFKLVFNERLLNVEVSDFARDINIYPVPARNNTINLAYNGIQTLRSLTITDINGKTIRKVDLSEFNSLQTFDISNLRSGLYLFNIEGERDSFIKKVIIER